MQILFYLTSALFAIWCIDEIAIGLLSLRNQSKRVSSGADRLSFFIVWLSTLPPIGFAFLIRDSLLFAHGFGSLSALFPWLGYVGCLALALGISIRIVAVATLNRQFTTHVSILDKHAIVDKGIYRIIRHPAYLGHLASLLGMGLVSENWVSLAVLVVLPLAGILYRIHVEERALLRHFGPAYHEYARRTNRLLPGIW
jgi:protein-S-isoprenylcysteine O-methyltransferase Ste14